VVPADDLVSVVLDAVAALDLGEFRCRHRADRPGRAASGPEMMVALLLYGYCRGERSSWVTGRRCVRDGAAQWRAGSVSEVADSVNKVLASGYREPAKSSGTTPGVPMAKTKAARRLSRVTRTGLSELPSNATWLLAKALKPALTAAGGASSVAESVSGAASSAAGAAGTARSSVRQKAKAVKRSVVDTLPVVGHDSVAALMREADAAAEHARDEEARALSVAQEAKDSADESARVAHESAEFVQQVRRETERNVAAAVDEAKERFEHDRRGAETEARKAIEKAEAQASDRTREAERKAEEAQARAREAIQGASQALIEARDLASQAAAAAKEIAAQASHEAKLLEKQAQEHAAEAERRIIESGQSRRPPGNGAKADRGGSSGNSADVIVREKEDLDALTKGDLLRLTKRLDVEGRPSMSKSELIDVISREGGIKLDALTKEELLRLGRTTGSDVLISMTKDELITAISTHGSPAR